MTETAFLWRGWIAALRQTCAATLATVRAKPGAQRLITERWGFLPPSVRQVARRGPVLWLAVAPGGELLQCHALCQRLKALLPYHGLVLSTSNARSVEIARRIRGLDGVFFSPFDLPGPARRALRALHPKLVIAVEAAWNPILFREARAAGYTTVLLSGKMHSGYHRHPSYDYAMRLNVFAHLDWVAAKTEEDRRGFLDLGVPPDRVRVLGDLRYDMEYLALSAEERGRVRRKFGFPDDAVVFLAGSTRKGEETIAIEAFLAARQEVPSLCLVIVPRFLTEVLVIEEALRLRGETPVRRTAMGERGARGRDVIVVDTFGELSRLYGMADIAFVGGSILPEDSIGLGQNLIEPLAHRVPVLFGPHMKDWREITAALKAVWPGVEVKGVAELAAGIVMLARTPEVVDRLRKVADEFLAGKQSGAREQVEFLRGLLADPERLSWS